MSRCSFASLLRLVEAGAVSGRLLRTPASRLGASLAGTRDRHWRSFLRVQAAWAEARMGRARGQDASGGGPVVGGRVGCVVWW
ncbi:hypothetical protein PR001_g9457 [Phytophthora rubi]|uniref:Uncharacterized protein n=1 Tax=Phytophthora rubi TaxID=129364 RepID=A0A6A3MPU1_9STRA|nr:hypothetical protein PR001_g9457 [Phytophthora rubi]